MLGDENATYLCSKIIFTLNKENLLLAHDLVSDSIFNEEQEKKAEKNSLFENMEAMPAHLGGKEPSTRSHQDPSKEVCGKSVLDPILLPENSNFTIQPTNLPGTEHILRKEHMLSASMFLPWH